MSVTEAALWVLAALAYAAIVLWLIAWAEPRLSRRPKERRR